MNVKLGTLSIVTRFTVEIDKNLFVFVFILRNPSYSYLSRGLDYIFRLCICSAMQVKSFLENLPLNQYKANEFIKYLRTNHRFIQLIMPTYINVKHNCNNM